MANGRRSLRSSRHSASIVAGGIDCGWGHRLWLALSCGAKIVAVGYGVADGAEERAFQNFVPQGIS